jgi:hypothetical protein
MGVPGRVKNDISYGSAWLGGQDNLGAHLMPKILCCCRRAQAEGRGERREGGEGRDVTSFSLCAFSALACGLRMPRFGWPLPSVSGLLTIFPYNPAVMVEGIMVVMYKPVTHGAISKPHALPFMARLEMLNPRLAAVRRSVVERARYAHARDSALKTATRERQSSADVKMIRGHTSASIVVTVIVTTTAAEVHQPRNRRRIYSRIVQ